MHVVAHQVIQFTFPNTHRVTYSYLPLHTRHIQLTNETAEETTTKTRHGGMCIALPMPKIMNNLEQVHR